MRALILAIIILLPSYVVRFHLGPLPTTPLEVLLLILFISWGFSKCRSVRASGGRACRMRDMLSRARLGLPRWSSGELAGETRVSPAAGTGRTIPQTACSDRTRCLLTLPILFFILAGTISVFVAPDLRAAAGLWRAYIIEPILFFIIFLDIARSWRTVVHDVILALGISALLVSTIAIYQYFIPSGLTLFGQNFFAIPNAFWFAESTRRVTSVFGFPNAIGLYLAPITVLLIGYMVGSAVAVHPRADLKAVLAGSPSSGEGQNGLSRAASGRASEHEREGARRKARLTTFFLLAFTTLASILAMFFAKSEGALIATAAGLAFLGLAHAQLRRWTVGILAIALVAILLMASTRTYVWNTLTFNFDSGPIRLLQWKDTVRMLASRPIFGAGLSGYPARFSPYHSAASYIEVYQYPHNIILNFWSEMGLLGLIAFGWIAMWFFRVGIRSFHTHNSTFIIPLLATMTTIIVHGAVDVPYFKNDLSVFFWLLVALLIVTTSETSHENE